ncbi:hypothetical protein ACA910_003882 [Epithemia clementina (nom. ined.)]
MAKHNNGDEETTTPSSPSSTAAGGDGSSNKTSPAAKLKQALPKKATPFSTIIGDDCDRPACDDVASKMQQMMMASQKADSVASNSSSKEIQCPPKSGELGRASWTLLHSMAAWYPNKPSEKDRDLMKHFFSALAQFYPCSWCASDFQQHLKQEPVRTESRTALCQWLCMQHNHVNEKLGKPLFPCDMESLDERWRKSSSKVCNQGKGGGH